MDIPRLYEDEIVPMFLYSLLCIRKNDYCLDSITIAISILKNIYSLKDWFRYFLIISYVTEDHDNYAVLMARIFSEIPAVSKEAMQKFSELISLFLVMCMDQDEKFGTCPMIIKWITETPNKNNNAFCDILEPFIEEFENINSPVARTIKKIGGRQK